MRFLSYHLEREFLSPKPQKRRMLLTRVFGAVLSSTWRRSSCLSGSWPMESAWWSSRSTPCKSCSTRPLLCREQRHGTQVLPTSSGVSASPASSFAKLPCSANHGSLGPRGVPRMNDTLYTSLTTPRSLAAEVSDMPPSVR
ncbi:uncharacterized protein K441DRAFT_180640 [Cenococcum geophilum 1.58]|uniref:uncharacterized protein n=1 Tax=Cenococcum geophilum 1.58 TaxID=794803 RepID=UPI00358EE2E4|nr:hypothetical protein K441DRAFT_180640 [Cenococcum geophilum 1.58]